MRLQAIYFLSIFIMAYSGEIMLYLFICKNFKLKVNKQKAYILAVLFALYLPITDVYLGAFIGTRLIPLTVSMIVLIKANSLVCELVLLTFLRLVVEMPWYRCYWIVIIVHIIALLPYPIFYGSYFMLEDPVKGTVYLPVNKDNIILYLFFLGITVLWGLIIIKLGSFQLQVSWLEKIPKLSLGILYLFYGFVLLSTDKYLSSTEYKKVLSADNNNGLLAWISNIDIIALYGFAVLFLIVAAVNIAERKHLKIENNLLKEMLENQYTNYLSMQQQEMEIHKLYHDIGNHIETIRVLVSNGENLEASRYTENLVQQYRSIRKQYYCSNRIINAVLLQKLKTCDQNQIDYEIDINLPQTLPFKDIDLMSVFSNLLDNAIEGCFRNPNGSNRIQVKTAVIGNYLNIKINNTKSPGKLERTGENSFKTSKKDKKRHGYGLKILEDIINRYEGHKELKDLGNEFSALVMLRFPEEQSEKHI